MSVIAKGFLKSTTIIGNLMAGVGVIAQVAADAEVLPMEYQAAAVILANIFNRFRTKAPVSASPL